MEHICITTFSNAKVDLADKVKELHNVSTPDKFSGELCQIRKWNCKDTYG